MNIDPLLDYFSIFLNDCLFKLHLFIFLFVLFYNFQSELDFGNVHFFVARLSSPFSCTRRSKQLEQYQTLVFFWFYVVSHLCCNKSQSHKLSHFIVIIIALYLILLLFFYYYSIISISLAPFVTRQLLVQPVDIVVDDDDDDDAVEMHTFYNWYLFPKSNLEFNIHFVFCISIFFVV